jgi:hypothetical protein
MGYSFKIAAMRSPVFLILLTFSKALFAQLDSTDCSQFKTGVFAYRDDSSNAVLVKRTANLQEERIKKSGLVTRFKIRWLSTCSYEMTQVWSNRKAERKNNGATTIVIITGLKKDHYEYSCGCKELAAGKQNQGKMYRVE